MSVKREFLGETKTGAPIYGYHLTNTSGMEVCVLNYGAAIRNIIVPDNGHLMGAIGIAILARKNKTGKTYSLDINDIKFDTKAFECSGCANNCELLKIYKNKELIDSWGSKCGKY